MKMKLITVGILLMLQFCSSIETTSNALPVEESPIRISWHGDVSIALNTSGTSIGHELLWTANTTGTNYEESAVIVVGGIAYIGSCSSHGAGYDKLFAINVTTGDILWSNDTGPGYVGPTVDGDIVYIGSDHHGSQPSNEYLFAFDRFTGQCHWKIPIYGGIAETIQVDNQNLYFCSSTENPTFYCVNKVDGSTVWTYPTGFHDCPNKPMLKDGAIYAAFFNDETTGRLYKVNTTTGSLIWSKDLSAGPWDNSITADGYGRIFLAIFGDATINAYHESDGGLIWSKPLHGSPLSFNAVHNGSVFIADTEGYVYCFEASSGTLFWETKVGNVCDISSPTLSGDLLFIGTHDNANGAFLALSETTGEILWRYSTGCSITAPPSVADGMMFCGSDGWNAYAFDIGDGIGNWSLHRYDSWNTAYSPTGLTNWQYVRTDCSEQDHNITCIITNVYNHTVNNITLSLPYPASWYNDEGELLANEKCRYTIPSLGSGENLTLFIVPEPFAITITKPQPGIYLANFRILPFHSPVIIGNILVQAEVQFENLSQIDRVEFFLDNDMNMMMSDGEPPYEWLWKQRSFGRHTLIATAYLSDGSTSNECSVFRIF
jgi:outer membrane protein assembly factor BamB